jgi:hypothetical protein
MGTVIVATPEPDAERPTAIGRFWSNQKLTGTVADIITIPQAEPGISTINNETR